MTIAPIIPKINFSHLEYFGNEFSFLEGKSDFKLLIYET